MRRSTLDLGPDIADAGNSLNTRYYATLRSLPGSSVTACS